MKILVINPTKHDYLAFHIIEGLKKFDIELYYTSIGNGATNTISDQEFMQHYATCDYIFAIWGKCIYNGIPEPKYYLINQVNGWDRTVYIDGSEYNYTGFKSYTSEQLHPKFVNKARWYFKRECLPEHVNLGIISLPFAAQDSDFIQSQNEKCIDVLCSFGQTSTGMRKIAIEACNELKHEGYNIITDTVSDYLTKINQSYITIDAYGGGECNARMWQIMANQSCLFAQKYNVVFPNLIEGEHYIEWDSKESLKNKIKNYLGNKEKLSYITSYSYKNILENHTTEKRIEYLFKNII